jgi:hypothetical protein
MLRFHHTRTPRLAGRSNRRGNSGHVGVPKVWIGKEAIFTLKGKENKGKGKKKLLTYFYVIGTGFTYRLLSL